MTGTEEQSFVAALGAPSGSHERDDVSLVLACLRSSASVADLVSLLPKVALGDLADAYRAVEVLRCSAVAAFDRLLDDPVLVLGAADEADGGLLRQVRSGGRADDVPGGGGVDLVVTASCLMPVPVARLAANVLVDPGAEGRWVVADVRALAGAAAARVAELEVGLLSSSRHTALRSSDLLWNPRGSTLICEPYFVPSRVGLLSPLRLDELLRCSSARLAAEG